MIDLVKKFFGESSAPDAEAKDGEGSHDTRVATCALLLEMANIDGEFSEKEQADIIALLKKDYDLPEETISELLETSRKELDGSTDLWRFTNLINSNYSQEEKRGIIEMVWKVVYADGVLDQHEDYLVHKLARLLRLPHKELIQAKMKVLGK